MIKHFRPFDHLRLEAPLSGQLAPRRIVPPGKSRGKNTENDGAYYVSGLLAYSSLGP